MSEFKNILVIGATGFIGGFVLDAFERDASFNLTLLQRLSSKSQTSPHLKVIKIAGSYPTEDLVSAFKGHDVIINCIAGLSVKDQFKMIDAAIAAKVQRYIPSEFGLNNMNAKAQELNPVFGVKGKIQRYLRDKSDEGLIEWMSITNGIWLEWAVENGFMGWHFHDKKFVLWDDGTGYFSCTTVPNTAKALVQALKMRQETKNRNIFLSDFATTQKQLLDAIERIEGVRYAVESINSDKLIAEKQDEVRRGIESAASIYPLIEGGFATGKYGGHFEEEPGAVIMNERLGLPKKSLDDVVAESLRIVGALK
ncbi:NAD(P)-binding protein [Xylariaceae sp. FL0255]|nr:NAD(P)-binding protein [Xylariaceae sp. FL0255]